MTEYHDQRCQTPFFRSKNTTVFIISFIEIISPIIVSLNSRYDRWVKRKKPWLLCGNQIIFRTVSIQLIKDNRFKCISHNKDDWNRTITNNYWAMLSKISWFVSGELRLRQIIELGDTDKSWYFAITEFNNCFIIRSPFFWSTKYVKSLSVCSGNRSSIF